jgi:D-3-phosphoglycerate dehydrogenase / 2-oxoglutarate reductase
VTKPRIVAVVGARWDDLAIEEEALAGLDVELRAGGGASAEEIVALAGDAEVVLAGAAPRFDAAVVARLRGRGIVRYGVGVERIDLDAARRHGLWVVRVAEYGTEAVALHAVTLALAGVRRLHEADASVRSGGWGVGDLRPLALPSSMTAGVVGYGRIGRRVAQLLGGLGFRVLAHDPFVEPSAEAASLEDLLHAADVISLHAPGDAALLDRARLALLREGGVLVNTARGSLVDVDALAAGLRAGRPRVAALDVFPDEPPDLAPFADVLDRLILTPHMAWYTEESERTLRTRAAEAARALLRGERPADVVVEPT